MYWSYALLASWALWNSIVATPFDLPFESYASDADRSGPTVDVKSSCGEGEGGESACIAGGPSTSFAARALGSNFPGPARPL